MQLSRIEIVIERRERLKKAKPVLISGLVLGQLLLFTSCSLPGLDKKTPEPTVATVSSQDDFYTVKTGSISDTYTGIGSLVPSRSTNLYFKDVSGPLSKIYVNLNDTIKKGALVGEILPSDQAINIHQQELVIQEGILKIQQLKDTVSSIKNQITSANIDIKRLLIEKGQIPDQNQSNLNKSNLDLDQLKLQLASLENDLKIAALDVKSAKGENQDLNVATLKIKLQQLDNDIDKANLNIESAQAAYDKVVKADKTAPSSDTSNAVKQALLELNQGKTELSSLQNTKDLTQLELKIAQGDLGQVDLDKANLKYQQVSNSILSLNKSINAAQITVANTIKNNATILDLNQEAIQKAQIGLSQLNISLSSAQKSVTLAELDQQNNELLLDEARAKLLNCKLYSSVEGVVTYVDNVTETDIISANTTIIRVADPGNIVFQMTVAGGRYLKEITGATLTIGKDKFKVDQYTPKPGDQLDTSVSGPQDKNRLYMKIDGKAPKINLQEASEATLSVNKKNVILVPESCITEDNGRDYVNVLIGNSTETIEIIRGITVDGQTEVVGGLKPGDKIVTK